MPTRRHECVPRARHQRAESTTPTRSMTAVPASFFARVKFIRRAQRAPQGFSSSPRSVGGSGAENTSPELKRASQQRAEAPSGRVLPGGRRQGPAGGRAYHYSTHLVLAFEIASARVVPRSVGRRASRYYCSSTIMNVEVVASGRLSTGAVIGDLKFAARCRIQGQDMQRQCQRHQCSMVPLMNFGYS